MSPPFQTVRPPFVSIMGHEAKATDTNTAKWSNLEIDPPHLGTVVDVRVTWGDGKPLGKATVCGYLVERGWLYLVVAPKRAYQGPFYGSLTCVAGVDLLEAP